MGKKKKGKEDNKSSLKEYHEKYRIYMTSYKTVKVSLKSIIKNPEHITKIYDSVKNINRIRIHTYQFIKMFFLKRHNNSEPIPILTKDLVYFIMKLFCEKAENGRKKITSESKKEKIIQLNKDLKNNNNEMAKLDEKIKEVSRYVREKIKVNKDIALIKEKLNKTKNKIYRQPLIEELNEKETRIEFINSEIIKIKDYNEKKIAIKKETSSIKSKLNNLNNSQNIDNLAADIQNFYNGTYKKTMIDGEKMTSTNQDNILKYEAESILTNYENHIRGCFVNFLNKFIRNIGSV